MSTENEAAGTGAKSARRAPRKATGSKQRAMVIDDVPEVADMLSFMLRSSGYEVVVVFSAPAALAAARKERFDVVISDIGMPGMTGYELAKGLRQLPEYRTVPLIAVTGFNDYSDRQRALHAGFNAFLMKPIDPPALMDLIAGLTD